MPIESSWYREPHIRLLQYEGVVTTEDVEGMLSAEIPLYDGLQNKLYTILDMEQMTKFAFNPLKIPNLMKIMKHPNLEQLIVTGGNPVGNFWIQTLSKVMGIAPISSIKSLNDALEFANSLMKLHSA